MNSNEHPLTQLWEIIWHFYLKRFKVWKSVWFPRLGLTPIILSRNVDIGIGSRLVASTRPVSNLREKLKDKLTLLCGQFKHLCCSISRITERHGIGQVSTTASFLRQLAKVASLAGCGFALKTFFFPVRIRCCKSSVLKTDAAMAYPQPTQTLMDEVNKIDHVFAQCSAWILVFLQMFFDKHTTQTLLQTKCIPHGLGIP